MFHVKHFRIYIKVMFIMLQPFNRLFSTNNKLEKEQLNNNEDDVIRIDVTHITPNQFQPRTEFDQEKIEELAKTLHTHGIIQPIVVRKKEDNRYEIVAGERRWRAAKHLGWDSIPAIVKQMTDTETRSEEHTSELQSRGHLVCR